MVLRRPPHGSAAALSDWLDGFGLPRAVALALLLYTLRPLALFPSSVMGVASGLTFGPLLGCLVTLAGELLGAALAFSAARLLGRRWADAHASAALARWDRRLSGNGALTVCVLRLTLLPFDTVSVACGLTGLRLREFLLGTLLGGGFYIVGVTLLGGSASADLAGEVHLGGLSLTRRGLVLATAAGSFALGLGLAWRLRRRYTDGSGRQADKDAVP